MSHRAGAGPRDVAAASAGRRVARRFHFSTLPTLMEGRVL